MTAIGTAKYLHHLLSRTDITLPGTNVLETIYPYPEPPWIEPRCEVENVELTRDKAKERVLEQLEYEKN